MAMGLTVLVGGASLLMPSRRRLGCSLTFVNFALLDQRDRPEELRDRNHRADHQPGKGCRKHNRSENRHFWSVTGKRIGVADIVRGVMNGADVREADDADNEKTKGHRQHGLNDHARIGGESGQVGGLGLLHVDPRKR
jgi:hypothetical protein